MNLRWKPWALGAGIALAAYSAIGFWGVPWIVGRELGAFARDTLARQASVAQVRFNPFTLRFELAGLKLNEASGAPIFAVDRFVGQLQWRSLVRRAWSFAELQVDAPSAYLRIGPDGVFNLARLASALDKEAGPPRQQAGDSAPPRLVIESFRIEQGRLDFRDEQAGYANVLAPIALSLTHFSTLPEENDSHSLTARTAHGAKLAWKGSATLVPLRANGTIQLEGGSLPDLAFYLKSYTQAAISSGQLDASLPYSFSYDSGRVDARLSGARLAVHGLALARQGASDPFATLSEFEVTGIDADLQKASVVVNSVRAEDGRLKMTRNARGELDLAALASTPKATVTQASAAPGADWAVDVKQVVLDRVALEAVDESAAAPVRLGVARTKVQLQVQARQSAGQLQLNISDGAIESTDIVLASAAQPPVKVARVAVKAIGVDLAQHKVTAGSVMVEGGRLNVARDKAGRLNLEQMVPKPGAPSEGPAWAVSAPDVAVRDFAVDVADEGTGVRVALERIGVKLTGASSDLARPVKFDAGLRVQQGGEVTAKGQVTPGNGTVLADVRVQQLALAPLQPLLSNFVKLKLAAGAVSAQGKLATGKGTATSPQVRYAGTLGVDGLVLNEEDGAAFASWKSLGAEQMTLAMGPNRLEIPELRLNGAQAKLIIEDDRSLNAARLLVKKPEPVAAPAAAASQAAPVASQSKAGTATAAVAPETEPFPVRIRRLRLQDSRLDFTDLSLRPQFGAKIHELNGAVNGLSTSQESRSQIELDGRVDEFGLARIRGELNPFAFRDSTDINVVFQNVDMVAASPYSMKFAGYRVAEGKISLDLRYKVRNAQLEGDNKIVIDRLTLGERVDSPDAIKIPLSLAIAILKDSDGRIDIGLPVSGSLDDPQFSYGALVWKAVLNVLTKIVTAPFRALGAMLGVGGEKLEAITFDAGSAKLLPPEQEKLKQVATVLAKREQLKLAVPGQYSEVADGAALRTRAVRSEVAKRAGIKLAEGEEPGPMDVGDRAVRTALRELFAARFGEGELDKEKKAAEAGAQAPAGSASAPAEKLPIWQRVGKMVQGEPQVADARAFYGKLQERLIKEQPLAADALTQLGTQRAAAVAEALKANGIDPARVAVGPPEGVEAEVAKPVPLKLGLSAR